MTWQPDGWDVRTRIGVLVPHADIGPESELNAMAPDSVGIYAARVPFEAMAPGGQMDPTIAHEPVRAFAAPPHIDEGAELLAAAPLHAIAFGFTSSAYLIGPQGEAEMIMRLQHRTRGIPVVATCSAALQALRAFEVRRVALIDPPWFDAALNAAGARYYESAGFEVVYSAPCPLPSGQTLIELQELYASIVEHVPDDAEAVVVGGNGFRAVGVVAALEEAIGRPVLTANQVLLWAALKAAGADPAEVTRYGRVFSI